MSEVEKLNEVFERAGIYGMEKETANKLLSTRKEPEGTEVELHRAQAGVLGGFTQTEVFGLKVGEAGAALLTLSVWDALRGMLGGVLPAQMPVWFVPAVGAMVVNSKMVRGWMGDRAANAAGIMLTADAIQALFNVRGLVSGLVGGVRLGQTMRGTVATGGNGNREITSIEEYNRVHGLA